VSEAEHPEPPDPIPAPEPPPDPPPEAAQGGRASAGDEATSELAATEDRLRRALADLDNYRKRSAREVDRRVAERTESLLLDWLEAVDSVERALRMAPDGELGRGLRSVLEQMDAILAREGVQRIGSGGEAFDPVRHEAISVRETADVPDRTVLESARSGFALGDRVLRPAQVVVSRVPEHAA
jgi:molecular chaperone GrpE